MNNLYSIKFNITIQNESVNKTVAPKFTKINYHSLSIEKCANVWILLGLFVYCDIMCGNLSGLGSL